MGYNRSGHTRMKRLKRRKKHMEQLVRKAAKQESTQPAASK
ncbi:MAG: hypothetical protein U0797_28315 [Gemmataceae bacterium]